MKGIQVTDFLLNNTEIVVKDYFKEKGYYNTDVNIVQRDAIDEENSVVIDILVDRSNKIKVRNIFVEGNSAFTTKKIKKFIKNTKEKKLKNFLKSSKYIEEKWDEDKLTLIEKFNEKGYRDALIISDSIVEVEDDRVDIYLKYKEGNRYYFNDVSWVGNTVYSSFRLDQYLNLKKGDTYNKTLLDERLSTDDDAVSNLYLDNGYLFFNVNPVETVVGTDSINIEMRIVEGKQAYIDRVKHYW